MIKTSSKTALFSRASLRMATVAAAALAAAACASPEQKVERYTKEAFEYLEKDQLGRANVQFQNALKINEEHIPALEGLAEIAERKNEFQAMFGFLQAIVRLQPDNVDALVKLAKLYLLSSDETGALENVEKALSREPNNADAIAVKAATMLRLDNSAEAVELAKKAIEINPASQEAVTVLASERINASDLEGALAYLEGALATDDSSAVLHLLRIQILSRLDRDTDVRAAYQRMIKDFPEEPAYRRLYASLLIGEDDLAGAREVLEGVAEISPDDVDAVVDVVRINYKIDGAQKAREVFKSYVDERDDDIDLKFAFANFLRLEKDFTASKAIYDALAAKRNDDGVIRRAENELAAQALLQGDRETAERYIDKILEEDEQNSEALIKLAGLKINDNKLDEAILDLRTVLGNDPENQSAKLLLAAAFEQKGDISFAESQMAQAVETSKYDPGTTNLFARFLLRHNRVSRAEEVLAQSLAAFPNDVKNLKFLAALRLRQQNWQGAEEIAGVLEEVGDQDPIVSRILGAAYSGLQDYTGAIEVLTRENARSPLASRPLATLVNAYLRSDRAVEAEALLDKTLAQDPGNYDAHLLLAQVHRAQARDEEAIGVLRKAIAEEPARPEAYEGLYQIYIGANRRDEAAQLLDDGLKAAPTSDGLKVIKADLLIADGKKEEALAIYEDILARRPSDLLVSNNFASLMTELRDDEASLARAAEAAKVLEGSESGYFLDTLGWAQYRNGDVESAVANLEKAVRAAPQLYDARYHLGVVLIEAGETERGRAELKTVVDAQNASEALKAQARRRLGL